MKYKGLRKTTAKEFFRESIIIAKFCLLSKETAYFMYITSIISMIMHMMIKAFDIDRSIIFSLIVSIIVDIMLYASMKKQFLLDSKALDILLKEKAISEMNEEELNQLSTLTDEIEKFESILYPLPFNKKI